MDDKYNLLYQREDGTIIKGRRLKHTRRIELEDGKTYSHTWAGTNLDYLGTVNSAGTKKYPHKAHQYEVNANGFKVRKKAP